MNNIKKKNNTRRTRVAHGIQQPTKSTLVLTADSKIEKNFHYRCEICESSCKVSNSKVALERDFICFTCMIDIHSGEKTDIRREGK